MLQTVDKIGVFDQTDRAPHFLILDGHGSIFDLLFLQYINTAATKLNVCIGVPYGTSYWEIGDSPEQNGSFKLALTKCKRDVLTQKERRRTAFAIEKEDIVDVVSKPSDESFARIATDQKAVAERGWGPLNYNLLLHPEIQLTSTSNLQTETNNYQPASSIAPSGLNLSQGITGTLFDQVVQYRNREDARNGINLDELARQRKETALRAIASNK